MNDENIYWLFSSSAQAIATFVAFLLAGYTLVHAMMDSLQQRDDTLDEIHAALIRQYYQQIRALAIITGAAVLASLAMLYLNGFVWPYKGAAVVVAAALDIAAIGWGITFVIRIIDPDKYTNAAKRLIAEETQGMETAGQQEDAEVFLRCSSAWRRRCGRRWSRPGCPSLHAIAAGMACRRSARCCWPYSSTT